MSSILNHASKIAILDPAIFDLDILTSILEDIRPFFRPDPTFPDRGITLPPEWNEIARTVFDLLPQVKQRKTQLGLGWFKPRIAGTGRN